MSWFHYLLIASLFVFGLIILMLYLLYRSQEKLIFYPETLPSSFTFQFDEPFEERNFEPKKGILLNSLLFKAENSKGLIIYYHGNAGSIGSWGHRAKDFLAYGYDVLIWDYRGYGKSTGKIKNERTIHADAEFIYDEMIREYEPEKISFVGCSLGTGIAARMASLYPSNFLILVTPYFNFKHTVDHHYRILPTSFVLKYHFNSNEYLAHVNCPIYLIHGTNDETVPYESSLLLKNVNQELINLTSIEGGAHNNLPTYEQYHNAIKKAVTGN